MPFVTVWQALFTVSEIAKRVLEKHDMEDYPSSDGVEKVLHPNLTLSEFSKSEKKTTKIVSDPSSEIATVNTFSCHMGKQD